MHEDAVVAVEFHHVGDGAERDQIEQLSEIRLGFRREHAAAAKLGAQREHDVEHYPHARDALARECAPGLVRIHDAQGLGQVVAGEMVVGDEHGNAEALCLGDAFD